MTTERQPSAIQSNRLHIAADVLSSQWPSDDQMNSNGSLRTLELDSRLLTKELRQDTDQPTPSVVPAVALSTEQPLNIEGKVVEEEEDSCIYSREEIEPEYEDLDRLDLDGASVPSNLGLLPTEEDIWLDQVNLISPIYAYWEAKKLLLAAQNFQIGDDAFPSRPQ